MLRKARHLWTRGPIGGRMRAAQIAAGCKRTGQSAPWKRVFSGAPSLAFWVAGASRSYASHFVKDAAACSVPEITASEHCSVCSAPARTMSKCRLYQVVDGVKTGPVSPHTPIPRARLSNRVRRDPANRLRGVSSLHDIGHVRNLTRSTRPGPRMKKTANSSFGRPRIGRSWPLRKS